MTNQVTYDFPFDYDYYNTINYPSNFYLENHHQADQKIIDCALQSLSNIPPLSDSNKTLQEMNIYKRKRSNQLDISSQEGESNLSKRRKLIGKINVDLTTEKMGEIKKSPRANILQKTSADSQFWQPKTFDLPENLMRKFDSGEFLPFSTIINWFKKNMSLRQEGLLRRKLNNLVKRQILVYDPKKGYKAFLNF